MFLVVFSVVVAVFVGVTFWTSPGRREMRRRRARWHTRNPG